MMGKPPQVHLDIVANKLDQSDREESAAEEQKDKMFQETEAQQGPYHLQVQGVQQEPLDITEATTPHKIVEHKNKLSTKMILMKSLKWPSSLHKFRELMK